MKQVKQITHNCSTVSTWCSDDSFFSRYTSWKSSTVASYQYTATNCIMISKDSSSPPTCFLHTKTPRRQCPSLDPSQNSPASALKELLTVSVC